jgi:hypothetical protein
VRAKFANGGESTYTLDGKYREEDENLSLYPHPVEIVKKATKPSINWEHVGSKFNYLAEDANGDAFLYEKEPFITMTAFGSRGGEIAEVHMFASYVKGICDWKESLVKRPEGNSHDG